MCVRYELGGFVVLVTAVCTYPIYRMGKDKIPRVRTSGDCFPNRFFNANGSSTCVFRRPGCIHIRPTLWCRVQPPISGKRQRHGGSKRSRERGHNDYVIIRLGQHSGQLDHVEINTNHFKGNYPESCELH
ncbi:hypothetical protein JB92DRAFT_431147 [Gautieria morchelliformis]|nr:hypothetical protein JB92DRAFT_431147 [Gautieria morchelliformis]